MSLTSRERVERAHLPNELICRPSTIKRLSLDLPGWLLPSKDRGTTFSMDTLDIGHELDAFKRETVGESKSGDTVDSRLEMLEHMLVEERHARRAMEGMVRRY